MLWVLKEPSQCFVIHFLEIIFTSLASCKTFNILATVKPVLSGHSKIDKTKVLKAYSNLMKVQSIALSDNQS